MTKPINEVDFCQMIRFRSRSDALFAIDEMADAISANGKLNVKDFCDICRKNNAILRQEYSAWLGWHGNDLVDSGWEDLRFGSGPAFPIPRIETYDTDWFIAIDDPKPFESPNHIDFSVFDNAVKELNETRRAIKNPWEGPYKYSGKFAEELNNRKALKEGLAELAKKLEERKILYSTDICEAFGLGSKNELEDLGWGDRSFIVHDLDNTPCWWEGGQPLNIHIKKHPDKSLAISDDGDFYTITYEKKGSD